MKTFLQKFGQYVVGVLSGFDRLVLRGHIRQVDYLNGMNCTRALDRNGCRERTGAGFRQQSMSLPREVLPDRSYMITHRYTRRS